MFIADDIRALEKAGLISLAAPTPDLAYVFRHALIQQAAYNTMLKSQRQLIHRAVADTLERLPHAAGQPDMSLADLAYHCYEAGDWSRALAYATRAGEQAQARYAAREAVMHFSLAVAAAQHASAEPPPGLLRARGGSYEMLGAFEPARADLEAALRLAHQAGDWRGEWQVLLDLGFLWASRDYDRTGDHYQQALRLARAHDDRALLAHSLNRVGNWHFNVGQPAEAVAHHQEARAAFEQLGDRRGLAQTLDLLGLSLGSLGATRAGQASYEQALALFRALGDRLGLASTLSTAANWGPAFMADTIVTLSPLDECLAHAREALDIAREIGWRAGEAYAHGTVAMNLLAAGDYAAGAQHARLALQVAQDIGHNQWTAFAHIVLALYHLDLHALPAAQVHAEQALALAHGLGSRLWNEIATFMLALALTGQNQLARAEAPLRALNMPAAPASGFLFRLAWYAAGELALARQAWARALQIVDGLIATAAPSGASSPIPRLWLQRGQALAGLGRLPEAEAVLGAGLAVAGEQGVKPLAWRLRAALGHVLLRLGRTAEAERQRAAARAVVDSLAAAVPEPALRDGFRRAALEVIAEEPNHQDTKLK